MRVTWSNAKSIRSELKKVRKTGERFFEGLSAFTKSHLKALAALTDEELAKLGASKYGTLTLGWVMESAATGLPKLAIRLADAIVTKGNAKHLTSRTAHAALYVVQDDNLHLGVNAERLRRTIDLCLPLAEREPDLFVMAAFCAAELKEWDEAIALLGKAKKARAKTFKSAKGEKLLKPIAKDARFLALYGRKAPKQPAKPLKPVKMTNAQAISLFRKFARTHGDVPFGDVTPVGAKETNVDFWFANKSKAANDHFQCFATTGDGSLLAMWNIGGKGYDAAPVIFLGSEGDLAILGENVPDTLALLARCGDEGLDGAVQYDVEPTEPNEASEWVAKAFGRRITEQPFKVVAALGRKLGLKKLRALTKQIGFA